MESYSEGEPKPEIGVLVRDNVLFAKRVAGKFYFEKRTAAVELDDCEGVAMLALCEAAKRYEPIRGIAFRTYCFVRIRGALLDMLRRTAHGLKRCRSDVVAEATPGEEPGDWPSHPETRLITRTLAETLTLKDVLGEINLCLHMGPDGDSLDLSYAGDKTPEESTVDRDAVLRLRALMEHLPAIERRILEMHYFEGIAFAEIRKAIGAASKSWVSRLHYRAMERLRTMLERQNRACLRRMAAAA